MKDKNIKKLLIIEGLVLVCWLVVVLLFTASVEAGFYLWCGLGFGIFSFVAAGASLFLVKGGAHNNTTEISLIPVYITAVYLVAAIAANSNFVIRVNGNYKFVPFAVNFALFILFISVRMFTDNYVNRVDRQTAKISSKVAQSANVSSMVAVVISGVSDKDIKQKLLKLKETIDYGSNVSNAQATPFINKLYDQLNTIQDLINTNADKAKIEQAIDEAENLWKTRNSLTK